MDSKVHHDNPVVLISGATAGIGKATAYRLAGEGYRLILTARREQLLHQIVEDLIKSARINCLGLVMDVRNRQQVEEKISGLAGPWKNIDILINNAGLAAGLDPVQEADPDDWDQMIDTNVKGLLYLSHLVSKGMVSRRQGHIVNISSIAGKEVYSKGSVYCATKHAVEALTKGMRLDLLPFGIKVSSVSPGAVNTEFSMVRFKGDHDRADKVYEGFIPLTAEDVADAVHYILTRPSHVNIQDILIMPAAQGNATTIHRKG
ncbi:MAG: SDR family NAD(P)-dependent oxidoreductase [Bacteroidales bacterium]|nr:SDR family NAD(P)-dependent oxidoreductase [Bacteroidales bacterium]